MGEGNGTQLQYSCLENPMDGGVRWAAVHGVTKTSDTTEQLHFHFSLSCVGEGSGNPLHCSCLENPRDRGAWWDAVYGVAQSRTRLKRLSSSSSILKVILKSSKAHVIIVLRKTNQGLKWNKKIPPNKIKHITHMGVVHRTIENSQILVSIAV